jgi:hypothetical protein
MLRVQMKNQGHTNELKTSRKKKGKIWAYYAQYMIPNQQVAKFFLHLVAKKKAWL